MVATDAAEHLDATSRGHLQRVVQASEHMGALIDALLELAGTTRTELAPSAVSLSAISEAIVDDLRRRDPQRVVEVAIAGGLVARADPRLARALLENLISNAWKFTGRREHARIEVGERRDGSERTFFVRDNGAGFDQAYADKLFKPFQRLHGSEFPGTGIGLATVQQIVDRHRGRIWATTAPGEGATFWFSLPD
jgi:light-regulated signal transduction histidine kinase (bacteriophytochrome)